MDRFIDLDWSYLEVELRPNSNGTAGFKTDANPLPSDTTNTRFTYVTNNIGHTIFKQMNLYMNGIVMSAQTNTYALNYTRDEGRRYLPRKGG